MQRHDSTDSLFFPIIMRPHKRKSSQRRRNDRTLQQRAPIISLLLLWIKPCFCYKRENTIMKKMKRIFNFETFFFKVMYLTKPAMKKWIPIRNDFLLLLQFFQPTHTARKEADPMFKIDELLAKAKCFKTCWAAINKKRQEHSRTHKGEAHVYTSHLLARLFRKRLNWDYEST